MDLSSLSKGIRVTVNLSKVKKNKGCVPLSSNFWLLSQNQKNGKSTFLRFLHDLMGDYAKASSTQTFMDRGNDSIRNDLASLHDARLVTTSEVGRNGILDATVIKELTGGDPVTCRFLYRESFSYLPKFKLIMAVNIRPRLSDKDQAI